MTRTQHIEAARDELIAATLENFDAWNGPTSQANDRQVRRLERAVEKYRRALDAAGAEAGEPVRKPTWDEIHAAETPLEKLELRVDRIQHHFSCDSLKRLLDGSVDRRIAALEAASRAGSGREEAKPLQARRFIGSVEVPLDFANEHYTPASAPPAEGAETAIERGTRIHRAYTEDESQAGLRLGNAFVIHEIAQAESRARALGEREGIEKAIGLCKKQVDEASKRSPFMWREVESMLDDRMTMFSRMADALRSLIPAGKEEKDG
jgi:hypothetical protein